MRRLLCLLLALVQVLPCLGAALPRSRQRLGQLGMGYGVVTSENHEYLVDTSQPYAEVIQEKTWLSDGAGNPIGDAPVVDRYDIGLDRLRVFRYQLSANGPPTTLYSNWLLFDGLGSTRMVLGDSGSVVDEFGYSDAFGIPYRVTANGSGRDVAGPGFFLNGQQWDGGSSWGRSYWSGSPAFNSGEGLYFNRARYYQPGLGRFIGQDPVLGNDKEPVSLHRYFYANQEPTNAIDPDGRMVAYDFSFSSSMAADIDYRNIPIGLTARTGIQLTIQKALSWAILAFMFYAPVAASVDAYINPAPAPNPNPDNAEDEDENNKESAEFVHGTESVIWNNSISIDGRKGAGDFGIGFYTFNVKANGDKAKAAAAHRAYGQSEQTGYRNSKPILVKADLPVETVASGKIIPFIVKDEKSGWGYLEKMRSRSYMDKTFSQMMRENGHPGAKFDLIVGKIAVNSGSGYHFVDRFPNQWKFEPSGVPYLINIRYESITNYQMNDYRNRFPSIFGYD